MTGTSRRCGAIARSASRRLADIDSAQHVEELRDPPENRLERLKGNRAGQWSICVNDRFRICFVWNQGDAEAVEIVDYASEWRKK
jgi:proteic killer suppression protein